MTADPARGAALPLLTYREVGDTFFCRVAFSVREIDDTLHPDTGPAAPARLHLTLTA